MIQQIKSLHTHQFLGTLARTRLFVLHKHALLFIFMLLGTTATHLTANACTCCSTASSVTYFNVRPASVFAYPARQASSDRHILKKLAQHDLVDIQKINPRIRVDLRYASKNNFTGKKIYRTHTCYLKKATALKLDAVQKELETQGLGLKIWDGYRPPYAQKKLWALVPDPRYVAPPAKGSKHSRGCSVDLTLVTRDGKSVPMPTDFDDFSPKAHQSCADVPAQEIKNRVLLETVMRRHGFAPVSTEWWHFDDADWQTCPLLDVAI